MSYIEKFEKLEKVAALHLKGYNYSQIGRELNVTPAHAKHLVEEYKEFVKERAQSDPDLLDRLVENTLEVLETVDMISREAWETYEQAKDFEMIQQRNASLKNLMDITDRKAKLLNLMGGNVDSGATARLRKAERVNEIVSSIIKEVIADCPNCRVEAQIKLQEAFSLMDREEAAADMEELPAIEKAEVIDVEEVDEEAEAEAEVDRMMGDILSD